MNWPALITAIIAILGAVAAFLRAQAAHKTATAAKITASSAMSTVAVLNPKTDSLIKHVKAETVPDNTDTQHPSATQREAERADQ